MVTEWHIQCEHGRRQKWRERKAGSPFWIMQSRRRRPYIDRIKDGKFLKICEFQLWEPQRLRIGSSVVLLLLWWQIFNFQIIYIITVQVSVSSRQLGSWITVGVCSYNTSLIFLQWKLDYYTIRFLNEISFYQTYCWIWILFLQNIVMDIREFITLPCP